MRQLAADVGSWLSVLVVALLPGLGAAVLWSPTLASRRLRSLFRALPITDRLVGNYLVASVALSIPWLLGLGWALHRLGSGREPGGTVFLNVSTALAAVYVLSVPVIAGVGLPRAGIDWDPNRYGVSTWLLLGGASAWYAAIFAVPSFLFGVVVSLPA